MKNYQEVANLLNKNWVKVLTKNDQQLKERFNTVLQENNNIIGRAILQFRRELYQEGRGNITYEEIEKAYQENNITKLYEVLQELFLEYLPKNSIEIALKILERKGKTLKDLYELHTQQPFRKIIRLAKSI